MNGSPDKHELTPHRRVRLSIYLAFLLLGLLAITQACYSSRIERMRSDDLRQLGAAGLQRGVTHEVGRLAALSVLGGPEGAAARHAQALADLLERSAADAVPIEAALARQVRDDLHSSHALAEALAGWQIAREKLQQRCITLLQALELDDTVAEASAAVQREVEPAFGATRALVELIRTQARDRSAAQSSLLQYSFGAVLCLLVLLTLMVVEPTAQAVRAQVLRMRAQSDELERLAMVAAHTSNRVMITDPERRIQWVNAAFTRGTGYALEEVLGRTPGDLLHTSVNDEATMLQMKTALARGEAVRAEMLSRSKNGDQRWLEIDIQPLHHADGSVRCFVSVATDITERRRLQEQLRHSSRTDLLTGLPNRAVVLERVQRAIEHARRHPGYGFAVLFMDFDRFKQVNDTLGHAVGDALLQQIARRIEDTLRPGDAVARAASDLPTAARIGGDEFVIVLEGVRQAGDARVVADRLQEVLSRPYQLGSNVVSSSASIGIVSGECAGSADEVLRDADTAMYEAKRAGRGTCVVFDNSMHERVVQALELENDLRRALRDGELFVVYQPVLELATQALVGVEALVRWRHPKLGIVAPLRFLGVAEEAGLIDEVGQQVLQAACRQFADWRARLGRRAPRELAVNLSRVQLKSPSLAREVQRVLQQHDLPPAALQLEITESLAAQDARVQATLGELKALGVRLALDDFGTGHSSLACLHQLPVDTVKIDRSFVGDADTTEYHQALIDATIRVAQTLGMTTVAEGVETAAQAALLTQLRCDRAQGWLFSKPLPADDLELWLVREAVVTA